MLANDPLTAHAKVSAVCYQHCLVMVGCCHMPICRWYIHTPAGLRHARCFAVGFARGFAAGKRKNAAVHYFLTVLTAGRGFWHSVLCFVVCVLFCVLHVATGGHN